MLKKVPVKELIDNTTQITKYSNKEIHSYNFSKLVKKYIQELQGVSTAVIYDGKIDNYEIELLKNWLIKNDEYLVQYPLSDLKKLFSDIILDNIITVEERESLLKFLIDIAASPNSKPTVEGIFTINPEIIFQNKNYLFTGNLIYGSRSKAQNKVIELGGNCLKSITLKTNYLVVGSLGSEDYKFSRFGTKIEEALMYNREKGAKIDIIKEQDFVGAFIKN